MPLLVPFQRAPPKTVETELTRRLGPVNLPPRRRSVESFRTCSHHLQKQSEWVRSRYRRTGYRDGSARITRDSEIGRDRAAHGNFARIADHWGTYISFHPVASPWMHFRLAARRWRIREIFLVLLQDSPNVIWNCKRHFVVCAHLTRLGGDDDDSSRQKRVRVTVHRPL